MQLEGKRTIIVGGASGIGAATVSAFAKEGAAVVVLDVADDAGKAVAEAAAGLDPGPVTYRRCDVTSQAEVDTVIDESVAALGGLDALIMCAGIERQKPAEDLTGADIDEIFDVHFKGTAFTNAAAFRAMRDTGGSIVNYSSGAGVTGYPGSAAYSAAKGAILAYTRTVAQDWGPLWIRVNAVCPGAMTPMVEEHFKAMPEEVRQQYEAIYKLRIPLGGKLTTVENIASVNVFLASDASSFMTGQTIGVDGGWTMPR
jgi:NAD(P)-dependent dehydrogenase (short-subunit alcohol dehydrogenase family)